ncbi:MAG: DUF1579 domain-containing protein [Ignavibacteria bacterium]|nr:DUF1579 domain-containing protein [Ignavibacteria bacterium]
MSKFEESLSTGKHKLLQSLVGNWEGVTKTWFEPGKLADESPMKGTIRSVLGGRFIMHEYKGSMDGKPYEGITTFGYELGEDRFHASYIDSFHYGASIMLLNGVPGSEKLSVLGSYSYKVSPEEVQHWGWRIEIDIVDSDNVIITIFNITPTGEEAKGVETVYKRVK